MIARLVVAGLVTGLLVGCTRATPPDAQPSVSAGIPSAVTVATADFPSAWLAERVGGKAVEVLRLRPAELADSDADLLAYVPGLDPQVDAAAEQFETTVDLTADLTTVASPRDPQVRDPYVWFDPLNIGTMSQTMANALTQNSQTKFEASQFYGLRAFAVQNESLQVDQQLQEKLNPCRIATLVVEAPVLTYFARSYAFTQVPLIAWRPTRDPIEAVYFTLDAEPAVRKAARAAGVKALPVDTLTQGAPRDDLLQGVLNLSDLIAAHQNCPLVKPQATDRPR